MKGVGETIVKASHNNGACSDIISSIIISSIIIIVVIIIIVTTTIIIIVIIIIIITIISIIITFILIQEIGFTESLSNWETFTGPNSAQLPFLCVITQTLGTVNVDLELDYLHF